jgi:hypothetical protein
MPLDEGDRITRIIDAKDAGSLNVAGKTITVDGLVAKNGNRRVLPDWETADDKWDHEFRVEQLRDDARRVLTGRRRDVFEQMVIGPLAGDEKPDVRTLADKYSVPTTRIYEDLARGKEQMKAAHKRLTPPTETRSGERCQTCGRPYGLASSWSACERGYNLNPGPDKRFLSEIHPECLAGYRAKK